MADRWARLHELLSRTGMARVVLSFEEIERILGHALPTSFREHKCNWTARHMFSREHGYRPSFRGVDAGHVAFVRLTADEDLARRERRYGMPSVWDGLIRHLKSAGQDHVLLGIDEIDRLRGVPLPPAWRSLPLKASRWAGLDKPWAKAGFRVTLRDVSEGQILFYRAGTLKRPPPKPKYVRKAPTLEGTAWQKVADYLERQGGGEIVLTFDEIERLRQEPIPPAFRNLRSPWHGAGTLWSKAGWGASFKGLTAEKVRFYRTARAGGEGLQPHTIWDPLLARLAACKADRLELALTDLEALCGVPLPPSARSVRRSYWPKSEHPWVKAGWRVRLARIPEDRVCFVRTPRADISPVPSVWSPLVDYLRNQAAVRVVLEFDQIAQILGLPLPATALENRSYWQGSKQPWNKAGFKGTCTGLPEGFVSFSRQVPLEETPATGWPPGRARARKPPQERPERPGKLKSGQISGIDRRRRERASIWDGVLRHLESAGGDDVILSIDEIERLRGTPLPPSARSGKTFWKATGAWMQAGWTTTTLGVAPGHIRFLRVGDTGQTPRRRPDVWEVLIRHLEDSRAKEVVLKLSQIETLRGKRLPPSARNSPGYWGAPDLPWRPGWVASAKELSEGRIRFVRSEQMPRRLSSEIYDPVIEHLAQCGENPTVLSLTQIERLIGEPLPPSLHKHRSAGFWQSRKRPWFQAGFRAVFAGIPAGHVGFEKVSPALAAPPKPSPPPAGSFRTTDARAYKKPHRGRRSRLAADEAGPPAHPVREVRPPAPPDSAPLFAGVTAIVVLGGGQTSAIARRACDYFSSPEFQTWREAAEASGLPWYVLDGLYGLLLPTARVEPHPAHLASIDFSKNRPWRSRLPKEIAAKIGHLQGASIAVLAAPDASEWMAMLLELRGAKVSAPTLSNPAGPEPPSGTGPGRRSGRKG